MSSLDTGSLVFIIVIVLGCCGVFVWISLVCGCVYLIRKYCSCGSCDCCLSLRTCKPNLRTCRGCCCHDNEEDYGTNYDLGLDPVSSMYNEGPYTHATADVGEPSTPAPTVQAPAVEIVRNVDVPINPTFVCPYRQICERFLRSLSLSEEYLEPDPKFNLCYCENCLEGRQDRKVYERGIPRKKYTVPIGWTRFSLKLPPHAKANNVFNEWHVAFHGTASENVKKILKTGHLVLPGNQTAEGSMVRQPKGHFTKYNKPVGFDVDQIFVSPSIKYSGCEVYAKATCFQDTGKNYKCRTVFQVLIKPGSYSVGRETIGAGDQVIDSEFDNSEIEWSTKQYGSTIMYGLLIKAEE